MRNLLIACLGAASLTFASTQAQAISSVTTTDHSCSAIQQTLTSEGEAMLRYTSMRVLGLPIYDRYVGSSVHCGSGYELKYSTVPAADTQTCRVAKCVPKSDAEQFYRPQIERRVEVVEDDIAQ